MPVRAKCPRDEKYGLPLPYLDIMNVITLNDYEFIYTILGF
jgi:hypothetical protein